MSGLNSAVPGVFSQPTLLLKKESATVTAIIDFDRLRKLNAKDDSMGSWVAAKLFTGRHPIAIDIDVSSAKGQMTIHPTAVSISGATVSGDTLHFLINQFVLS